MIDPETVRERFCAWQVDFVRRARAGAAKELEGERRLYALDVERYGRVVADNLRYARRSRDWQRVTSTPGLFWRLLHLGIVMEVVAGRLVLSGDESALSAVEFSGLVERDRERLTHYVARRCAPSAFELEMEPDEFDPEKLELLPPVPISEDEYAIAEHAAILADGGADYQTAQIIARKAHNSAKWKAKNAARRALEESKAANAES